MIVDHGEGNYGINPNFQWFFSDFDSVMSKFGNMVLATQYIKEVDGKEINSRIKVSYHISSFISQAKAVLDGLAILLNDFYKLGFTGGDVDLKKGKFVQVLGHKNKNLANLIIDKKKWIDEVVEWRDALIHRLSIYVGPYADIKGENPYDVGNYFAKMPRLPLSTLTPELVAELNEKYGSIEQDIIPFCNRWNSDAKSIIEACCKEIAATLPDRKKK